MLNNQPPDGGQTPLQGEPPGTGQTPTNPPATTTPSGQGQPNNQQPNSQYTAIDSLPVDIQYYIKRLRHENEEANKKAKAEAQAKQQAEEARLKEQGEWKSLAEKHEARVKELESVEERLKAIATQVNHQIDTDIKDWPKSVKAMDPGPDAPIDQRIAWRNSAQAIVADMQNTARAQAPGNPPNPRSASPGQQQTADIEELMQRSRQRYGRIF